MKPRVLSRTPFTRYALAPLAFSVLFPLPSVAETYVESALGGLEEIMVTARRRTESLQDVPVSASALTAAQLDNYDLSSLEKIASMTPQFTVGRSSNGAGAQLTMRGIGSSSTSIGIEQSVAVIVDGVYYGQGRVINEGFFDLQSVEILKGPQALFFGKNATAGVVSLTTADPSDEVEARLRAGYEFGSEQVYGEAVGSFPLTQDLGIRVALRGSKMYGGYYKNLSDPIPYPTFDVATNMATDHIAAPAKRDAPEEEEIVGRVTLKWEPSADLAATLKSSISRNDVNNSAWNVPIFACPTGRQALNPARPCSSKDFHTYQMQLPDEIAAATPLTRGGNTHPYNHYRSWQTTGTVEYGLDNAQITSVTNYQYNRNQWLGAGSFEEAGIWVTERATWRAFSQELRVLTEYDGPINVLFGGLYQKTKRVFDQNVIFAGVEDTTAPDGMRYVAYKKDSETEGETLSGYGQVIWNFLPDFELTAGARYTYETKDSYFVQPYVNPLVTGLFTPDTRLVADQKFTNWSPEATVMWSATEDLNIYGAYKTAYKSGGFSNSGIYSALSTAPVEDFVFDPEKGKGFEVGLKSTLLNNQLRLNLGAYRYNYTNLQVDFFNSPTFAFVTINAGEAVTKGLELEFTYAPNRVAGLVFHGSVNYNKSRYKDFFGPCYAGQTPSQGCTTLNGPGGAPYQDLSGMETAVAPEWTGTFGASYETELVNNFYLGLTADARYSDTYLASGFGNELSRVNDYVILNAAIRVGTLDDRWEFAIIGRNLTDKLYVLGVQDAPLTGMDTGLPTGIPADQGGYGSLPRTIQAQITFRY